MPLGAADHALLLGAAVLGPGDRHHLDLLELVLAEHARGVLARRPRLRAEALGMGGHPHRQRALVEDLAGDEVGQRHLRGRDQPPAVGRAVAVLGELRQLAGAEHRLVADEDRGPDLGQAVLVDVGVEHELGERPVQAHEGAFQDHEARSREPARRLEVEVHLRRRDLEVLARAKGEGARAYPSDGPRHWPTSSGPSGTSS